MGEKLKKIKQKNSAARRAALIAGIACDSPYLLSSLSIFCRQPLRVKATPAVELSTRVNEEGQAISCTSDYEHPATPETRVVDEFGKKVKNKDPATKKQQGYCPGKYSILRKPRSRKGIARAAPQTANTTTARARTIPRQMVQVEARQSRMRIKCQARSIPGTRFSKTRSLASIFPKAKAEIATMCA